MQNNDARKQVVQRLLEVAAEEGGFSLGTPWRYSDSSVVAVVPILRELEAERSYATLAEALARVNVRDTGSVGLVEVENKGDVAVFLRAGEVLAGSTQERAVVYSQVIPAHETARVQVACVHASRPLQPGAFMVSEGYTPAAVYRTLHRYRGSAGLQGEVWSSVGTATGRMADAVACYSSFLATGPGSSAGPQTDSMPYPPPPPDDLVQNRRRFARAIGDVIAKVPWAQNQVGLATVGLEGMLALEAYDLKQSWGAVREAAVKQQGEDLSRVIEDADQVFQYRPEQAGQALRQVLTSMFQMERLAGNGTWESLSLKGGGYTGEATVYQDSVIHLFLVKD
jgi:hypothetical protein